MHRISITHTTCPLHFYEPHRPDALNKIPVLVLCGLHRYGVLNERTWATALGLPAKSVISKHPDSSSQMQLWVTCSALETGALHCTLLYSTVLYFTVLYFTVLYFTVLYFTVLYFTVLYFIVLYLLCCTLLCCTLLCCTLLCCTLLCCTLLCCTLLCCTLLQWLISGYDLARGAVQEMLCDWSELSVGEQ